MAFDSNNSTSNIGDTQPRDSHVTTIDESVGIGVVPKEATTEKLARTLLRAKLSEYQPFLVETPAVNGECVSFAEELDIPVIEIPAQPDDESAYHTVLGVTAQQAGVEHVVVHETTDRTIDYERTKQTVQESDEFLVPAVTNSEPDIAPTSIAAIPAYNEAATIADVVDATIPHVDEVVVIDDGSDDDTVAIAKAAGASVIEHASNRGYGGALQTAFVTARDRDADTLVVLDGDGQHEPEDIPDLLAELETGDSEIAVGSRLVDDGETDIPLYRRFGLGVVNVLTNVSLGIWNREQWVKDTQSGFRAYDRTAIETLAADPSIGEGMDASTDILYHSHKRDYDVAEVGTTVYYDVEDGSSQHPLSHGTRLVVNILHMIERERPVLFVGLPGFLTALFGITLGYLTISNFMETGTFPLGLALAASVIFLTGLFLGLTATVLHALKQYLENGNGYHHTGDHRNGNGNYP